MLPAVLPRPSGARIESVELELERDARRFNAVERGDVPQGQV
jgi:hypothetical protein